MSTVTKNRLLHISDLPHLQKYTSNDINQLLPVHFNTLKHNLLTILHFQQPHFKHKLLVHDPNLTIHSNNYTQIKGGWCQDFDSKQNQSSLSCIKKSIEIGVIILNYLQAMCQASIKHKDPHTQDDSKILSKGQCFTRNLRTNNLQSYPQKLKDTLRRQNQKYNTSQLDYLPMQKETDCFMKQDNLVIAYNIYKKNKNYVFLTGVNECYTDNFVNLVCLFRDWNLQRLKIQNKLLLSFDKLFRANTYLQHLFSISRGFIFSSFLNLQPGDPFLPLNDLNDNKKHLRHLLSYFEVNKQLQNQSELIFSKFKQENSEVFGLFEDTFKLYRFSFTYKLETDLVEQRETLGVKFRSYMSKILGRVLSQIPINITVSYCFESKHDESSNQVMILLLINYKSHLSKHIYLSSEEVGLVVRNMAAYLNREYYEEVRKTQRNVADEVFKSSYLIFNKYNQVVQNNNTISKLTQKFQNTLSSSARSSIKDLTKLPTSLSNSRLTFSKTQSKLNLKQMTDKKVLSQKSTIFSKSIRLSEVETQYKKLLRSLQERQQFDCLLNPIDIKNILKQYLTTYQQIHKSYDLQKSQKVSLQFIGLCCQILTSQDIYHLIMKFQDSMECLCQYFMQEGNFQKMVQVGKLLSSTICTMFKEYLHFNKGFVRFRYHKVVSYIKKLLQKYYILRETQRKLIQNGGSHYKNINNGSIYESPSRESPVKNQSFFIENNYMIDLRELKIEDLIFLLQQKSASCNQYKNLLNEYMCDIFTKRPQTGFISRILYHFYITLLNNDHHQDLVAAFIADLFYQTVYFTNEMTSITLNNSRYRKNVTDLKEKKFYELIRDVGFFHHGLNAKNVLIPTLINTKPVIIYQQLIIKNIKIQKPAYFRSVVKMIQNSFFSQNFTLLSKQITKKSTHFESINRTIMMPIYSIEIIEQSKRLRQIRDNKEVDRQEREKQEQDPLVNIDISESGIFRDLISLNPKMKIAGMSLKEEYSKIMRQKEEQQQRLTVGYLLNKVMKLQIEQYWEYIQLAIQLKTKFTQIQRQGINRMSLNIDSQKQNQLLYLKQTLQLIYTKLSGIYQYLALSDVLFQINQIKKIKNNLNIDNVY